LENATSFGGIKIFLEYLEKIKLSQALRDPKFRKLLVPTIEPSYTL
jgi:hypothetical protein